MNNSLTVQGKSVEVPNVPDIRTFIAEKAGIKLPARVKGQTWITTKEVVALAENAGSTKEQIKAWRKELDSARKEHYVHSGMIVGMLAADPSVRKNIRLAKNAKGEVIGANATFRRERSAAVSAKARIAVLEAQLGAALAKLAGLPVS